MAVIRWVKIRQFEIEFEKKLWSCTFFVVARIRSNRPKDFLAMRKILYIF